jgi:DNA-binding NtrC family response regulator
MYDPPMAESNPASGLPRFPRARVLLVDRDQAEAGRVSRFLEGEGYEVLAARSGEQAFNALDEGAADGLVVEASGPGIDAIRIMHVARSRDPEICVIFIAETGSVDLATRGVLEGAYDFQTRPLNLEKLLAVLRRGQRVRELVAEVSDLSRRLDARFGLQNIVGNSAAMTAVLSKVLQVAPTDATVLITGETGTGKDLVGTAIHQNSRRRNAPLIALHCGDLTEGLVESELFGHEKGAFTGAVTDRKGRFELAEGGTLLLDEVGELSLGTQVKLLRVLQEREFVPVGGERSIKVDVRLIAATNRDLGRAVAEGRFREDLFYRLNVVTIALPALRHRPQDIPLLVEAFLKEAGSTYGKRIPGIEPRALQRMLRYPWPGNVRELKNVITTMAIHAEEGRPLEVADLPAELRALPDEDRGLIVPPGTTLAEAERRLIEATLKATDHDLNETARILGISLRTLYRRIQEYKQAPGTQP